MPAGRPPKPTALKKLQGTYRKDRHRAAEWQPPPGAPELPAHVTGVALRIWRKLVDAMATVGVLTQVDGGHLEGYCIHYARAIQADAEVKRGGLFVKGAMGGRIVNPAIRISERSWRLVDVFGAKLGLSPSDRRRVDAPRAPGEDRAESFLFGAPRLVAVKDGGRGG